MKINFAKNKGLVPAIVQDAVSNKVLMLGYMNEEAYEKTRTEGKVTFYSRSKQRLWTKGETSGNYLIVKEILLDCDGDTLLIKVNPMGPVCHTGADTCFAETNKATGDFIYQLEEIIRDRQKNPREGSYTNKLFNKGIKKIVKKTGEEAIELIIEALDNNIDRFLEEAADLMYHYL